MDLCQVVSTVCVSMYLTENDCLMIDCDQGSPGRVRETQQHCMLKAISISHHL
jgi:hypothetical protein